MKITRTKVITSSEDLKIPKTPKVPKLWMGVYYTTNNEKKKVYFEAAGTANQVEKKFKASIPEPYTKAIFRGSVPSQKLAEKDGFKYMKITASNHVEVPDEAGFEAWIYEKFGMKKSEVSSAKWEELGTKYFNKYRSETIKKNATYKDDKRLSPTSLRYKGYLINLDRGGDGYNVYDKYRELEDAGFASLDDAKKFVDEISVESSIHASSDVNVKTTIKTKDDFFYDVESSLEDEDIKMFEDLGWMVDENGERAAIIPKGTVLNYKETKGRWIFYQVAGTDYIIPFNNTDSVFELKFDEDFKVVESSIRASRSTRPGDIIIIKKDYPVGWIDGEDLYLPAGTRLEYYGGDSDSGLISLQDIDSEEPQLVNLTEEQYYKAFRQGYFKKAKANVSSAEEVDDDENDLDQVDQEFTSKETSINSGKLPAIYKLVNFPKGSLVIDYGGGKFDNGVEYLDSIGVTGLVYDPYNRTTEHNRSVIKQIRENGGADIALCSNVLNVIKEEEARLNVLKNIRKLLKSSGTAYITVYEGKGTGEAKQSQDDAYQLHRKTADYLDEIHKVFPDATRKGKLIIATPTGEVTASCNFNINASYDTDEVTVGIYGDEVDGFVSVDQLVSYFKSKGIKVSDASGDMDYGWEMNLTGDPKKLFFAVCNNIPGYNSNSVDQFIDEYRIDDVEAGCDINAGYDPYDLGDEDLGLPFIKEELLEFGDSIAETFSNDILGGGYGYQLSDIYVDTDPSGKKILLHIEFNNGDITTDATVAIDKRRIKRWTDLFKYQDDILNQMKGAHDEWYHDGERPEWYHEMEDIESSIKLSPKDVETIMKAAVDVTTAEDLEKVMSSLLLYDKKMWAEYSEMIRSGEYSPASIGKMISEDIYADRLYWGKDYVGSGCNIESAEDVEYDEYGKIIGPVPEPVYKFIETYKDVDIKKQVSVGDHRTDKVYVTTYPNGKIFGFAFESLEEARSAIDDYEKSGRYVFRDTKIQSAEIPYKTDEFIKELQDKLYNKASKVLQTSEFGFPLNEIAEVLFVEIHEDDYNIIAEVRGELSYEGMDTLARALNPIVEKYSKNAYFDMVEPGIMEAYLPKDSIKKIQSSTVEGARFQETTDYDNPIGDTATYDVEFDFKIVVSDEGDYDIPETETFESIYDDDYEIEIDDEDGVSDKILNLIEYNIPEEPGTYRVSGIAKMKYDIDGIYIHTVAPDWDEDLPGTEYVTDDVDIDFDERGSWVEDFQCQKVD